MILRDICFNCDCCRFFGAHTVSWVQQRLAAGLYYHPDIQVFGHTIKYGVISIDALLRDLVHWESFYVSGRLQKPVGTFTSLTSRCDRCLIHRCLECSVKFSLTILKSEKPIISICKMHSEPLCFAFPRLLLRNCCGIPCRICPTLAMFAWDSPRILIKWQNSVTTAQRY